MKGWGQVVPGVFGWKEEWFNTSWLTENTLTVQCPFTQLEKCLICLFHLLAERIFWKELFQPLSAGLFRLYFSHNWFLPYCYFFFFSIGHTFWKINLKSNLTEMDWILTELGLGEPFSLKKGFAPDSSSSFDALNFLSWPFSQLGSAVMSEGQASSTTGRVQLLKSCWVGMEFPAGLLWVNSAPAWGSANSIFQKKKMYLSWWGSKGDEGACSS